MVNTEYRRVCGRCQQPILARELSETRDVFSNSGPGAIIDLHLLCPRKPPPSQTAPVQTGR